MTATEESSSKRLLEELQRLKDIEEIKQLKARYFRYVDLHWWPELRELFTDDAVFEIEESTTSPRDVGEFINSLERHLGGAVSVHHGHMPEIELLDTDTARGIWAMFDVVEPPATSGYPVLTGFGHYTEEYRRVGGRWRIARLRLTRLKRTVDGRVVDDADVRGRRDFVER